MTKPYRVMQVTETGEAFNAFEGDTPEACNEWIEANKANFSESQFYCEEVECPEAFWGE